MTETSSDVADDEKFFFRQEDNENESDEQIVQREKKIWQNAQEGLANVEPISLRTSVKEFTKLDRKTTSYFIIGIEANERMRVEQNVDLVLKKSKLKLQGHLLDEVLLTTDRRYKHYKANEDGIILREGLIFQKNLEETVSVK